jgi:hypothetical protein
MASLIFFASLAHKMIVKKSTHVLPLFVPKKEKKGGGVPPPDGVNTAPLIPN